MLVIDGSQGEGGGQILRSSLALSALTQTPFRIEKIRARRSRPGLMKQHLAAVRAAAEICGARIAGDQLGSGELTFEPGSVRAGRYSFAVGSAGSSSLVLQTVLPPLALAKAPSTVQVRGGTHNPMSPPFEFLARALFPQLHRMGVDIEAILHAPGFYPAGGGHAEYRIEPAPGSELQPIELLERGAIRRRQITALVSKLPRHIGEREIATIVDVLGWDAAAGQVVEVSNPRGPGNAVMVEIGSESVTEVFTGFGEKGVRAEDVAGQVAREASAYLEAGVPVGEHMADQLLLWMAIAGRGAFRTVAPSDHTRTQRAVIAAFLDVTVAFEELGTGAWEIRVG